MKNKDVNKLVKQLQAGNEEAFDKLYDEFKNLVFYIVMNILRDRHLSEELTQDVFLRMYQNIDKYTLDTNFKAWLVKMAKNLAINELKKQKHELGYDETIISSVNKEDFKTFEFIDSLKKILTEDELEVIVLYYVYNLNNREISEALNKSINTVLWLHSEAKKKLSKYYERGNRKWEKKSYANY